MLYGKDNQFHDMLITPTNEEIFERFLDIPGINEIHDDNVDPLEEVEIVEPEEYISEIDKTPEAEEIEEESASGE